MISLHQMHGWLLCSILAHHGCKGPDGASTRQRRPRGTWSSRKGAAGHVYARSIQLVYAAALTDGEKELIYSPDSSPAAPYDAYHCYYEVCAYFPNVGIAYSARPVRRGQLDVELRTQEGLRRWATSCMWTACQEVASLKGALLSVRRTEPSLWSCTAVSLTCPWGRAKKNRVLVLSYWREEAHGLRQSHGRSYCGRY